MTILPNIRLSNNLSYFSRLEKPLYLLTTHSPIDSQLLLTTLKITSTRKNMKSTGRGGGKMEWN